jgi:hypothetical protein
MQRTRRPDIAPLSNDQELTARRVIRESYVRIWHDADTWANADRLAAQLVEDLRAEGLELVAVRWPS